MHPGVLIEGNFLSVALPLLVETNKSMKIFSKEEITATATFLTTILGDDMMLMTGKMNKSSSFKLLAALVTLYTAN